ncbi:MAG: TatD family hydrolase [Candidatus Aenigmatarchaeota archaeon]
MIDVHCHLEQHDYDSDRDEVIEKCKKELKAVITSSAHPKDLELTMGLVEKHKGFVFATAGIHPEYIKEVSEKEKEDFFELLRKNKDKIVGIGEVGLDFLIEEQEWREKQKELFIRFISLAKELNKPLVIHARKAFAEAIEILEEQKAKNVLMHFFSAKELLDRVEENGWYISVNTTLLTSKKIKKIVRDMPVERILTETDSPWLGLEGKRNDPCSVKLVIQKIAEIKKIDEEEVDKMTTENAVRFFDLKFD